MHAYSFIDPDIFINFKLCRTGVGMGMGMGMCMFGNNDNDDNNNNNNINKNSLPETPVSPGYIAYEQERSRDHILVVFNNPSNPIWKFESNRERGRHRFLGPSAFHSRP